MPEPTFPFALRVPADVKAWLAAQAARNGSSQNSEIIRAIRDAMDRATQATKGHAYD